MNIMIVRLNIIFLLTVVVTLLNYSTAAPYSRKALERGRQLQSYSLSHNQLITSKSRWTVNKCKICRDATTTFHEVFSRNFTKECLQNLLTWTCVKLKLQTNFVCKLIISDFRDEFLYVANELVLNPNQLCGLLLPDCGQPVNPFITWNISLPGDKPPVVLVAAPPPDAPQLRILHVSDIHYDTSYTEGSEADCTQAICCRNVSGEVKSGKLYGKVRSAAGHWGYRGKCDIPLRTLEDMFQHISKTHKIDMIYWTGDLASHADWLYTREGHIRQLNMLASLFKKYFPDTVVYSALGNHEGVPVNSFPPEFVPKEYSKYWLTDELAKIWTPSFNGTEVEAKDIKFRASYVTKPFPALRIISLNTLYCDVTNFWLYLNQSDPDGTMSWLRDQLLDAEKHNDKVHIIAHIPTGDGECLQGWAENYYLLVNRFESTIAGQFFGHTHLDDFVVYYEGLVYPARPTGVVYLAPSVSTYTNLNPAYRIYTVDGNRTGTTSAVLNHETYWTNITAGNLNGSLKWEFLYDAKTAYGLDSLQPDQWNDLINTMKTDNYILGRYQSHRRRTRPSSACGDDCRTKLLCYLRSGIHVSERFCGDLIQKEELSISLFSVDDNERYLNETPKRKRRLNPTTILSELCTPIS